jgi:6-phosphogluconate dehydrogenase
LVEDAINKEIPIPVISQSIVELFKSRTEDSDTYKAIALMMRHGFSGHPFGSDNYIAKERKTSRIRKSIDSSNAADRQLKELKACLLLFFSVRTV